MFNPRPRVEVIPLHGPHACLVIDDALLEPERLVALAQEHRADFAAAPFNAYPGLELRMAEGFSSQLDDFFRLHVRAKLGARRTLRMYSRLALVTTPPGELQPRQSICHRDRLDFAAHQCIAASVLYLFKEPALGGTSFFVPNRPQPEIDRLVHDSGTLDADAFASRYALARDYMRESNAFFSRVLTVPARWNRLIFYDGRIFHSGDIAHPHLLTDQPCSGRLTLNGFFTCSRGAAAG
jgi:hypothetical protein